jgi:hypothetical protein
MLKQRVAGIPTLSNQGRTFDWARDLNALQRELPSRPTLPMQPNRSILALCRKLIIPSSTSSAKGGDWQPITPP